MQNKEWERRASIRPKPLITGGHSNWMNSHLRMRHVNGVAEYRYATDEEVYQDLQDDAW